MSDAITRTQEAIEYLKSAAADIRVCGELFGYKLTPALESAMRSIEGEIAVLEYKVRELEATRDEAARKVNNSFGKPVDNKVPPV